MGGIRLGRAVSGGLGQESIVLTSGSPFSSIGTCIQIELVAREMPIDVIMSARYTAQFVRLSPSIFS